MFFQDLQKMFFFQDHQLLFFQDFEKLLDELFLSPDGVKPRTRKSFLSPVVWCLHDVLALTSAEAQVFRQYEFLPFFLFCKIDCSCFNSINMCRFCGVNSVLNKKKSKQKKHEMAALLEMFKFIVMVFIVMISRAIFSFT